LEHPGPRYGGCADTSKNGHMVNSLDLHGGQRNGANSLDVFNDGWRLSMNSLSGGTWRFESGSHIPNTPGYSSPVYSNVHWKPSLLGSSCWFDYERNTMFEAFGQDNISHTSLHASVWSRPLA
jgi:hypothetical protein